MVFKRTLLAAALALVCSLPASRGWSDELNPTSPSSWQPVGPVVSAPASTTSAATTLGWPGVANVPPPTAYVCNSGSIPAFVAIGGASLKVTTRTPPEYGSVNGASVAPGGCRSVQVNGGTTIAAVTASGNTTLNVQTGIGTPVGSGISAGYDTPVPNDCVGRPPGTLYNNGGTLALCTSTASYLVLHQGGHILLHQGGALLKR